VKIEKISETVEIGQRVRYARQLVMSEIEHAKPLQAAYLPGHFGQVVLGQHQSFKVGLFPY
jgi:hypothetical protein